MTKLIHREGNIFDTEAPAIGHGINNKGVMGAGIALQFKQRYPDMYETYQIACEYGNVKGGQAYAWEADDFRIYNIVSQEEPGANASYDFLISGVQGTLKAMLWTGETVIALPRIGSGIGGLDEGLVEHILTYLAEHSTVDIELWTYKR